MEGLKGWRAFRLGRVKPQCPEDTMEIERGAGKPLDTECLGEVTAASFLEMHLAPGAHG